MADVDSRGGSRFLVRPVSADSGSDQPGKDDPEVTDIIIQVPQFPPRGLSNAAASQEDSGDQASSPSPQGRRFSSSPPRRTSSGQDDPGISPPGRKASCTSSWSEALSCLRSSSEASPPPSPPPRRPLPFQLPSAVRRSAALAAARRMSVSCASTSGQKMAPCGATASASGLCDRTNSSRDGSGVSAPPKKVAGVRNGRVSFSDPAPSPLPRRSRFECLSGVAVLQSPKKELLKQYRLHIFVAVIFVISVAFISCAWIFHNKARAELAETQRIFFDPRQRTLTLSVPSTGMLTGKLAHDIPKWHLPLHCPISEEGNPARKECVWKKTAVLRIQHFTSDLVQCYNVSWESLSQAFVPYDCYDFRDALWYGPSNLTGNILPVRGQFSFNPNRNQDSENGVFGNVIDYSWLSSKGVAIVVTSEDPLRVEWNTTKPGQVCLISNYSSAFYNPAVQVVPTLNYSLCTGPDMVTTYEFVRQYFGSLNKLIAADKAMMALPQWSTKAHAKSMDVTEEHVVALATKLKSHDLSCSLLHLDGKWEAHYGDLAFDPERFLNYSRLLEAVGSAGCQVALQLSPFFDYQAAHFHEGVQRGYFVADAGAQVPGLARWQHGVAAVLDISNPRARSWFTSHVTGLSANHQISAFRWTYGNGSWLPFQPHFRDHHENPNKIRRLFGEALASLSKRLVLEEATDSQHLPAFLGVQSSLVFQGDRACLGPTIETALTVGLLGYPWLLADGFRVDSDQQAIHGGLPSRDVFIRWMQLAVFFPAVKYSLPPWTYDEYTVQVARNMSLLHEKVVLPLIERPAMVQDLQNGLPILRPVWWAGPDDDQAHVINDEFLIGEALLVAPILCEGIERRDIYVPKGIWKDRLRESLVVGPKWLRNYKVELYEVAHFSFEHVYEK